MRLDDKAVRVAIGLRLGLELCSTSVPLWSPSGRIGTPCICLQKGRQRINSAPCSKRVGIARAVLAAAIPNTKEPQGLCRSDGKRFDGLTLVLWQSGRSLVWDVTVVCRLVDSYVASAASSRVGGN